MYIFMFSPWTFESKLETLCLFTPKYLCVLSKKKDILLHNYSVGTRECMKLLKKTDVFIPFLKSVLPQTKQKKAPPPAKSPDTRVSRSFCVSSMMLGIVNDIRKD